MQTLKRIALALVIIGAINWGLIGLFQFDLVAAIFGGQGAGLSRIIYTLVGLSGLVALTMLFDTDMDTSSDMDQNQAYTRGDFATEFAEEPDLHQLYNPSEEVYEGENEDEQQS